MQSPSKVRRVTEYIFFFAAHAKFQACVEILPSLTRSIVVLTMKDFYIELYSDNLLFVIDLRQ